MAAEEEEEEPAGVVSRIKGLSLGTPTRPKVDGLWIPAGCLGMASWSFRILYMSFAICRRVCIVHTFVGKSLIFIVTFELGILMPFCAIVGRGVWHYISRLLQIKTYLTTAFL